MLWRGEVGWLAPSSGYGAVQPHTHSRSGHSYNHHHGGHSGYEYISPEASEGVLFICYGVPLWLHALISVAASKGLLDAAHFCYLMAQVGLGVFTKKSTKMVLIGSNHRLEIGRERELVWSHVVLLGHTSTTAFLFVCSLPFFQFATNEAIQRTEAYEYAQSLGSQPCSLPNFQVGIFLNICHIQNFIVLSMD